MNPLHFLSLIAILFFNSCSTNDEKTESAKTLYQKGEYLYRNHNEHLFVVEPPQPTQLLAYPWEERKVGNHLKITKEFFRCKGSNLNPVHSVQEKGEVVRYFDCGGASKHTLPLRENKEFIYPILMDLLNYLQAKTQKRVIITSGHRCPEHNSYVDPSSDNLYSKHMIGAEVSFYVQGLENNPELVVKCLQAYFSETPKYEGKKEFLDFKRYEKDDVNVATQPWYNKEIFIKLFKKEEGRNFDNRHPYPYLSIQVRYDLDTNEKVIYTWDKANHNYFRI